MVLLMKIKLLAAMKKMAAIVDGQNTGDEAYLNMSPDFNGLAFKASCDLAIKGRNQPSGYTEPILMKQD